MAQITKMFRAHFRQGWVQVLKCCNQHLRQVLPLPGQNAITAIPGSNPGEKRARLLDSPSERELAIYKSRGEASEDTKPADTLILDLEPPDLSENTCLLFKALSVWYFVMAT